jgi:hypothetical protein
VVDTLDNKDVAAIFAYSDWIEGFYGVRPFFLRNVFGSLICRFGWYVRKGCRGFHLRIGATSKDRGEAGRGQENVLKLVKPGSHSLFVKRGKSRPSMPWTQLYECKTAEYRKKGHSGRLS